jgi:F-box interacting protein
LGGALTLLNPVTGETLPPIPPPCTDPSIPRYIYKQEKWGNAYNLPYHPITGRYKVVHVPCIFKAMCHFEFQALHVLTLGEARTWKEVPTGGAVDIGVCKLNAGIVSIDGMTHWASVTGDGKTTQIVSLDLTNDNVVSTTTPLPLPRPQGFFWLTEVRGRLGFVDSRNVWVLEKLGGQYWSHRYSFQQNIPRWRFVFDDYMLAEGNCRSFYGHQPKPTSSSGQELTCNNHVLSVGPDDGTLVAKIPLESGSWPNGAYQTFTYVETTEPLSIYAAS